ncbi:hypothetical protein L3X38_010407 [Prunus dulcis]|uniref:Uncharacterized protein n=1 Tax=Prunus dulcis TaxID=3755 RepID=A0AAD4ZD99_PRUDU|nr:hypothetical protein L3X38_010407 [Prunus dulcis]
MPQSAKKKSNARLETHEPLLEPLILLPWLLELDILIRIDPPITRIVALTEGHPRHKPKKNHGGLSSNHVSEGPTKDEMQSIMSSLSDLQIQQMLAIMHDKPVPDKKSQVNVAATKKAATLPESTSTSSHPMPLSPPDTTTEPDEPGPALLLSPLVELAHSSLATSPPAPTPEPPPLHRSERI